MINKIMEKSNLRYHREEYDYLHFILQNEISFF